MRYFLQAVVVGLLLAACGVAEEQPEQAEEPEKPPHALAPYLDAVAEKGFPVGAWAFWDGSGAVDVAEGTEVTRYSFDKEGEMTEARSPLFYSLVLLRLSRFSAHEAASATVGRLEEGQEMRAVILEGEGTEGLMIAAIYDENRRFIGKHLYHVFEGLWDGYEEAVGERDPLDLAGRVPQR